MHQRCLEQHETANLNSQGSNKVGLNAISREIIKDEDFNRGIACTFVHALGHYGFFN